MTDETYLADLTEELADVEGYLAEAIADDDAKSIKTCCTAIVDLEHLIKVVAGEIPIDGPAPKGGTPTNEGIHSAGSHPYLA